MSLETITPIEDLREQLVNESLIYEMRHQPVDFDLFPDAFPGYLSNLRGLRDALIEAVEPTPEVNPVRDTRGINEGIFRLVMMEATQKPEKIIQMTEDVRSIQTIQKPSVAEYFAYKAKLNADAEAKRNAHEEAVAAVTEDYVGRLSLRDKIAIFWRRNASLPTAERHLEDIENESEQIRDAMERRAKGEQPSPDSQIDQLVWGAKPNKVTRALQSTEAATPEPSDTDTDQTVDSSETIPTTNAPLSIIESNGNVSVSF